MLSMIPQVCPIPSQVCCPIIIGHFPYQEDLLPGLSCCRLGQLMIIYWYFLSEWPKTLRCQLKYHQGWNVKMPGLVPMTQLNDQWILVNYTKVVFNIELTRGLPPVLSAWQVSTSSNVTVQTLLNTPCRIHNRWLLVDSQFANSW